MKKILIYSLFLANLIVLVWSWWYFNQVLISGGDSTSLLLAISRLSGLLATVLALTQLLLIGRIKWIEEVFGLDKLSKVHKWNGYAVLILIMIHVVLVTKSYSIINQIPYFDQYLSFLTDYDDIFKSFLAVLILVGTVGLSITIIRRQLKYEWWYYVHILNYLTFVLFVGHQLELGTSSNNTWFEAYWIGIYAFTALHISWFRFFIPLYNFWQQDFTITKVDSMNGVAVSIYISGRDLKKFKRQSGQFMILRFLQNGFWWQAHPFSLSWGANNSKLRITAKNLGDFTASMPNLKVGTKVLIDGPHGVFTSDKITKDKVLMIAGGIGITPLRSLAEELVGKVDLTLIYSAKTRNEAVLLDELRLLSQNNTSTKSFRLIEIYSNEQIQGAEFGMLNKDKLAELVADLSERDVFLCGPPRMMDAMKLAVMEIGLPRKQFHWEKFSL